jgi:hypothetical protein
MLVHGGINFESWSHVMENNWRSADLTGSSDEGYSTSHRPNGLENPTPWQLLYIYMEPLGSANP